MGSCSNTDIDPTYQYQYNNTQNITFLPVDTNLSSSDKKNLSYGKEYRSAVAKNYVPRKNLAQGGRTYFKPKFVINLPGLIKWPLVGKV